MEGFSKIRKFGDARATSGAPLRNISNSPRGAVRGLVPAGAVRVGGHADRHSSLPGCLRPTGLCIGVGMAACDCHPKESIMRTLWKNGLVVACIASVTACASITGGTHQKVDVQPQTASGQVITGATCRLT